MIGTVVGATVIVTLTACCPQDRITFLGLLALWGGLVRRLCCIRTRHRRWRRLRSHCKICSRRSRPSASPSVFSSYSSALPGPAAGSRALMVIDWTNYQIAVSQADAALQQAQASVKNIDARMAVQHSQISVNQAQLELGAGHADVRGAAGGPWRRLVADLLIAAVRQARPHTPRVSVQHRTRPFRSQRTRLCEHRSALLPSQQLRAFSAPDIPKDLAK
jgi:hypothetical protein